MGLNTIGMWIYINATYGFSKVFTNHVFNAFLTLKSVKQKNARTSHYEMTEYIYIIRYIVYTLESVHF